MTSVGKSFSGSLSPPGPDSVYDHITQVISFDSTVAPALVVPLAVLVLSSLQKHYSGVRSSINTPTTTNDTDECLLLTCRVRSAGTADSPPHPNPPHPTRTTTVREWASRLKGCSIDQDASTASIRAASIHVSSRAFVSGRGRCRGHLELDGVRMLL